MTKMSFWIDEELLKQFKLLCVVNGVTMTDELIAFIKKYINKNKAA